MSGSARPDDAGERRTAMARAEFLGVGRLRVSSSWRAEPHAHDHREVILVTTGMLGVTSGDGDMVLRSGDVVIYLPGSVHRERVKGRGNCELVFFSYRSPVAPAVERAQDRDGRMRVIAKWLLEEQSSTHVAKRRVLDAHLASFLAEFEKAAARGEPTIVDDVREYARGRLGDRLAIDELAAHVHMSRAHFIRTYRKIAGRPPMEDIRLMRIEAARDLIVTTKLPLKAVAPRVGFADEFHLAHVFKQHLGVPPSYFRRRS